MLDTVEVARETKHPSAFVKHDFREVPIYALQESPTNPRRTRAEYSIPGCPRSAARLADLASVPVRVVQLTDAQVLEYQLIENAIREDFHPYEEAMAYKTLLESSEPRYDVASIAEKTGRSITHVYQRRRLAELIPDAAEVFQATNARTS